MEAIIKFKTGEEIIAEVNGDCFITAVKPAFPKNLGEVTVTKENEEKVFCHAELVECASVDDRYWFSFVETPEEIRRTRQMQANIEYLAMMTDVELEEE